jgi:hypothetical protein
VGVGDDSTTDLAIRQTNHTGLSNLDPVIEAYYKRIGDPDKQPAIDYPGNNLILFSKDSASAIGPKSQSSMWFLLSVTNGFSPARRRLAAQPRLVNSRADIPPGKW